MSAIFLLFTRDYTNLSFITLVQSGKLTEGGGSVRLTNTKVAYL